MRNTTVRLGMSISLAILIGGMTLANNSNQAFAAAPAKDDPHVGLAQNWDKVITGTTRFTLLADFANAAVRDNETGLVWEQAPDTPPRNWESARFYVGSCANKIVGGRKGWRLPSVVELSSLVDAVNLNPALPTGHPFSGVQPNVYWTATSDSDRPTIAWFVNFFNGQVTAGDKVANSFFVWCVRGGMNADQY
ncbi:Lcl C-terminal domain-containing protein [Nitrospira sp. CMX1]|nr:DUF1566 domain-containing protein [Nitrospira sp.]MBS0168410.1 DUF1566 domain-containing protein [Nitrospira sp.]